MINIRDQSTVSCPEKNSSGIDLQHLPSKIYIMIEIIKPGSGLSDVAKSAVHFHLSIYLVPPPALTVRPSRRSPIPCPARRLPWPLPPESRSRPSANLSHCASEAAGENIDINKKKKKRKRLRRACMARATKYHSVRKS